MKFLKASLLTLILFVSYSCLESLQVEPLTIEYKNEIIGVNTTTDFRAYNSEGKIIFQRNTTDFEEYKIVGDKMAYLDNFQKLKVIDSQGNILFEKDGVIRFQMTNKTLATWNYSRRITIVNLSAAKLKIKDADSFQVSDTLVAYRKNVGGYLYIADLNGNILHETFGQNTVRISNSFFAIKSSMGFELYNNKGELLVSDCGIVSFNLTDTFASYTDDFGWTTIINKDGEEIMSETDMNNFQLTNNFIVYKKNDVLYVHDSKGDILYSEISPKSYQIFNQAFAIKNSAGILNLINKNGHVVHWSAQVDSYTVTNTSLVYKSGHFLYVYDINGNLIKNINALDMVRYAVSDNLVAILYKTGDELEVRSARTGEEVISKNRVRRFQMSFYPEFFTWNKF